MSAPRPYDLTKPEELTRLYREASGYLRVDIAAGYGTDMEGRLHAMNALKKLEQTHIDTSNGGGECQVYPRFK